MAPPLLLGNMGLGKGSASQQDEACSGDERPELQLPRDLPRLPAGATRTGDFALQSDATRGHSCLQIYSKYILNLKETILNQKRLLPVKLFLYCERGFSGGQWWGNLRTSDWNTQFWYLSNYAIFMLIFNAIFKNETLTSLLVTISFL